MTSFRFPAAALLLALATSAGAQSLANLPSAANATGRTVPCTVPGTAGSTQACTPAQIVAAGGGGSSTETDPVYTAQKGQPNGAATLGSDGLVTSTQARVVSVAAQTGTITASALKLALVIGSADITDASTPGKAVLTGTAAQGITALGAVDTSTAQTVGGLKNFTSNATFGVGNGLSVETGAPGDTNFFRIRAVQDTTTGSITRYTAGLFTGASTTPLGGIAYRLTFANGAAATLPYMQVGLGALNSFAANTQYVDATGPQHYGLVSHTFGVGSSGLAAVMITSSGLLMRDAATGGTTTASWSRAGLINAVGVTSTGPVTVTGTGSSLGVMSLATFNAIAVANRVAYGTYTITDCRALTGAVLGGVAVTETAGNGTGCMATWKASPTSALHIVGTSTAVTN